MTCKNQCEGYKVKATCANPSRLLLLLSVHLLFSIMLSRSSELSPLSTSQEGMTRVANGKCS
jgi:hypothetical protein